MHYIDICERHLSRFRNASPVMVEIGVFKGGSLDMWSSYFGEGAKIIGIDINPDCAKFARENVDVFIGTGRSGVDRKGAGGVPLNRHCFG